MPKIKVRDDGQVKIPANIITRYGLRAGDVLDLWDMGKGFIFIPEKVSPRTPRDELFEIVQKAWSRNRTINAQTLERTINKAVRTVRAQERQRLLGS